ncbi:hypothetical protein FIV42_14115 [Persicimonas caeni]|uniref:Uncharacterized protein n=1 Tax=Persicimonas caeni TaxID=2292766 RepID=A0A4Y6PU36_PERCE|nr:hypothetical protein [Persicimonas caeni]QDG51836.1 hypothetical protein FIV42_14115 [Persicimonas caeni]QED33057.1 hypothetical protein FRD00_14110 [Persicimonas caeni]
MPKNGGTLQCTYSANVPDATARTNTATATLQNYTYDYNPSTSSYDKTAKSTTTDFTGSANVDFSQATITRVDECVDVSDDKYGSLGQVCVPSSGTSASQTFNYSLTIGPITESECGTSFVNVASFTSTETTNPETGSDDWTVDIECELQGGEGCTPGFWKNHEDEWCKENGEYHYAPDDELGEVFDFTGTSKQVESLADDTLADALAYGGGPGELGDAMNLLRHAVAALLNACKDDQVSYDYYDDQVISWTSKALAGDFPFTADGVEITSMEELKDLFEAANEQIAPGFCE